MVIADRWDAHEVDLIGVEPRPPMASRTKVLLGGAAAVLAAVVAITVLPGGGNAPSPSAPGPSPSPSASGFPGGSTVLAGWPDRSATVGRGVAEGALTSYGASGDVRWLYRGAVAGPTGERSTYVAVWVASDPSQPTRLVAATVDRARVDAQGRGGEGGSPWVIRETDAIPPPGSPLGLYLPYGVGTPDQGSQVFVLAPPQMREVRWEQSELPGARQGGADVPADLRSGGQTTTDDGVVWFDAGPLLGPVAITVDGGPAALEVTAGLSYLYLVEAAPPDVPDGAVRDSSSSGTMDGQRSQSITYPLTARSSGADTAYLRCYGRGPIALTVSTQAQAQAGPAAVVDCDGATHAVPLTDPSPTGGTVALLSNAPVSFSMQIASGGTDRP